MLVGRRHGDIVCAPKLLDQLLANIAAARRQHDALRGSLGRAQAGHHSTCDEASADETDRRIGVRHIAGTGVLSLGRVRRVDATGEGIVDDGRRGLHLLPRVYR